MGIFKLVTGGLVIAVIALFFYQNIPAFNSLLSFQLDLFIREPVKWEHYLYTLLLIAALLGFLAGFLLMLSPYLQQRRRLAAERLETQQASATESPVVEAAVEREEAPVEDR